MFNDNLIGHGIIDYLVVSFFIVYAIWAGYTKPIRILNIFPACLSFFFFIEIGPRLTPEKLVPAVFIITVALSRGLKYFEFDSSRSNYWTNKVALLLLVAFLVGLYFTNYFSTLLSTGFIKTRIYIQVVGYLNYILILIIARKECSKEGGSQRLIKAFLVTSTLLCVYGIYQSLAHEFGWAYRGIVYSANKTGIGSFNNVDDLIFRVNSLANEPKRLTYFLVIGIIILLKYMRRIIKKAGPLVYYTILIIHLVTLWLTYSTSIYISLLIFILILIFYGLTFKNNNHLMRIVTLVLIFGSIGFVYQKTYIEKLYAVRVEQQLEKEEIRAEIKGQEYMAKYLSRFIIGIGPGMYNFALAVEYPNQAGLSPDGKFLIPFNSGLITYLFDFGVIGFLILLMPFSRIILKQNNINNSMSVFIVFLYCTSITLNPSATIFYFIGAFEGNQMLEDEH